jgi:thioesterase domain-containing protein
MMSEELNSLITLNPYGDETPIVFIHPAGGQVHWYKELAKKFNQQRPVYAFMSMGLLVDDFPLLSVEETASLYITFLKKQSNIKKLILAGWSFGSLVAFEMNKQLSSDDYEIPLLVLLDPHNIQVSNREIPNSFLFEVLKKEFQINLDPAGVDTETNHFSPQEIILLMKDVLSIDPTMKSQLTQYIRAISVYLFNMYSMNLYRKSGVVDNIFLGLADDKKLYPFLEQTTIDDWNDHSKSIFCQPLAGDHFTILKNGSADFLFNRLVYVLSHMNDLKKFQTSN